MGGHDIELHVGQTLVGRHESCSVVIDDPLASRRHATLSFDGETLMVEDLQSVNGVLVNGVRLRRQRTLVDRDALRLGNQLIEVFLRDGSAERKASHRVGATTLTRLPYDTLGMEDELTVLREGERLETLVAVAEKVLAMGKGKEAERILKKALHDPLSHLRSGGSVDDETLCLVALYSARLASATGKGDWIDHIVELYQRADRVMAGPVVEQLFESVRVVDVLDFERLRRYLSQMQRNSAKLGPADRFLLRRLEGLERLALA